MNNIIETITAWPIIVQGALGSALFALISFLGQKAVKFLFSKWEKYSKQNNKVLDSQKIALIQGYINNDQKLINHVLSIMVFSSLHYLMKATLFVGLGLVAESLLPVFGGVGYFIGFIYLFKAMSYSPNIGYLSKKSPTELEGIIKELEAENS